MLRSVTKTCFAYAYSGTTAVGRLFRDRLPLRTRVPFVVCYHRVVENFTRSSRHSIPSMLISTAMLERHIDWLARRYSLVSLDEIGSYMESPRHFGKPPAAITFDDGYSDVYYNGLPLLKRKGIPSAVFTVTGLIGTSRLQIFDRLYMSIQDLRSRGLTKTVTRVARSLGVNDAIIDRMARSDSEPLQLMSILLNDLPHDRVEQIISALESTAKYNSGVLDEIKPLNWEMIEAMSRDGVTIGSHTKSHALLSNEDVATARHELCTSKQALEAKLQQPVRHLAYPDGRFDPAVVQEVSLAGYRYGYTICSARVAEFPLLTIPRKVLWERSCVNALGGFSSAVMNCHANGALDPGQCSEHNHQSRNVEKYANVF
jgi:peptidoglycan/xylan/chitin deacetylase (PgdA/CDA1 family)